MKHHASPDFWASFKALPDHVQELQELYEQQYEQRLPRRLARKAQDLGFQLVPSLENQVPQEAGRRGFDPRLPLLELRLYRPIGYAGFQSDSTHFQLNVTPTPRCNSRLDVVFEATDLYILRMPI